MKHGWMAATVAGLAAVLGAGAGTGAEALRIGNDSLAVQYQPDDGKLTLESVPPGRVFVPRARLSGSNGVARVSKVEHAVLGSGQQLEVTYSNGCSDRVLLFKGVPFAFIQPVFLNRGAQATNVVVAHPFSGTLDTGVPAATLKAWGTAGLTAVDKHPGSYVFLALADPATRAGVVGAWLTHDRGSGVVFSGCEGERATLRAQLDYGRLLVPPGRSAEGELFALGYFADVRLGLEQWADLVARQYRIRLPPQVDGYCTWYSSPHGGAADEKSVVELAAFAARELQPFGFRFVQIDDKWQDGQAKNGPDKVFIRHKATGPYPHGMEAPARRIRELGLMPGLWFMPFAGDHADPFFADKQGWFAHSADGKPYETPWGGTAMDMTHPDARAYLGSVVKQIAHDWGYTYFKMDGMWMGTATKQIYVNDGYRGGDDLGVPVVRDPSLTPIEAYRSGLRLIREQAGTNVFILGCCVSQNMRSFGGTFGLVDAMRIGPDNGANVEGLKRGPWTGSNRYFLNGRVWYNDPDPVYVRPGLPLEAARLICSWVGLSGQLHASSEWLPGLPPERLELLKRVLPSHGRVARPVDVLETDIARLWLLTDARGGAPVHLVGVFNWEANAPLTLAYPLARLGLDAATTYVGFDFWADRFVPPFEGTLTGTLPPFTCRMLALRPVADRPQVVSTSRHVTQGLVDLEGEAWDARKGELSGTSRVVGGDRYELRIVVSTGARSWQAESGKAGEAPLEIKQQGPQIRAAFTPATSGTVTWRVTFASRPVESGAVRPPTGLRAEASYSRVRLSWDADDAVAYRVTRSDGTNWTTSTAGFTDAAPLRGVASRYQVAARGWDGKWSGTADVSVQVPARLVRPPAPPAPDVQLSALKPVRAETGWGSVRVDTSCAGNPLTLDGKRYAKGVGVHARSLLVYAVPAGMKRFVAVVGLDDEEKSDDRASIVMKVFADVKEMGEPPALLAETPALGNETLRSWCVDVPLSDRVKELRLVVEDADDGIACDHADWAEAGFRKE